MMDIVRYVGPDACDAIRYQQLLGGAGVAVVDVVSAERNVTLHFTRDEHPVLIPMDDDVRDFVDLAVSVYIADEVVSREASSDEWTRSFRLVVPVSDVGTFASISQPLTRTLSFLAGDNYEFEFCQRTEMLAGVQHRQSLPDGFDAVCLFSGGVDSLLGAHLLLSQGKRLLLVGHQAEPITASVQKELARVLRRRFPDQVTLIQCRVARSKTRQPRYRLPDKVEDSHRPRSFLFLALAIAVARAADVSEVYMPENGLIAINPPLQISRMGSHSTRTAHPVFLTRLLDAVQRGRLYSGDIRNPFLYRSKSDMLRNLDPTLIPLVQLSVSCSHPSRYQDEGVRHCGYCVPCLYRRAAMMVCNLDRETDYAFDVFGNRGSLRNNKPLTAYAQSDVRAMIPFAQKVATAKDADLAMLVLFHGYFPPNVGERIGPSVVGDYSPWIAMLRRWAQEFLAQSYAVCTKERAGVLGLTPNEGPVR